MPSLGSSGFDEETTARCLGNKKETGHRDLLLHTAHVQTRGAFTLEQIILIYTIHLQVKICHQEDQRRERWNPSIHGSVLFSSQGSFGWDLEVTGGTQGLE